jgi:hypothetical protein
VRHHQQSPEAAIADRVPSGAVNVGDPDRQRGGPDRAGREGRMRNPSTADHQIRVEAALLDASGRTARRKPRLNRGGIVEGLMPGCTSRP